MKKGITPEAAQRLEAFLQKRAQNYQDTEEWSPGDAVQDVLGGAQGKELLWAFSEPLYQVGNEIDRIFDEALVRASQELEDRFQKAIEGANAAVSAEGFPAPDPAVWEGLKQSCVESYDQVLGNLRQGLIAFESAVADLAYNYQEAAIKEFQKAAAGTPGGTVP